MVKSVIQSIVLQCLPYLYHEEYREVGKEYHLELGDGQETFGNNGLT